MKGIYISTLIASFISIIAYGKEILTEEKLKKYLNAENPYIYTYQGYIPIKEAKKKYYLGELDLKLAPSYEKKDYPLSNSKFYSLFLKKRLINGLDIKAGYRKAQGTQEYNNIKTSKEGELQIGVKIPIIELLKKTNKNKLNITLASIEIQLAKQKFRKELMKLRYKVISTYYKTLYYKRIVEMEKELLEKAKKRKYFIQQKIKLGVLPKVYIYEAEQQIIAREQSLLKAKQEYTNTLNELLTYLNLPEKEFKEKYTLPNIEEIYEKLPKEKIDLDSSIKIAFQNRPELKEIKLQKKQIEQEKKYYTLLKYPKTNINLYGVEDLKYKSGFKISIEMEYPINRTKYIGKTLELSKKQRLLNSQEEKIKLEIKRELMNVINKLEILKKQITNVKKEIKLVKKLEEVEKEKLKHGASTLFYINQREIYTQKTKIKNLKYKLDYILTYKKYLNILNLENN